MLTVSDGSSFLPIGKGKIEVSTSIGKFVKVKFEYPWLQSAENFTTLNLKLKGVSNLQTSRFDWTLPNTTSTLGSLNYISIYNPNFPKYLSEKTPIIHIDNTGVYNYIYLFHTAEGDDIQSFD